MNDNRYEIISSNEEKYFYKKYGSDYQEYNNDKKINTLLDENKTFIQNEILEILKTFTLDESPDYNEILFPETLFPKKNDEIFKNIMKLKSILNELDSSINYYNSLFSLFRTLAFYIDIPNLNFFNEKERNILGINIQKRRQSLTIEFSSENVIYYSYAYNKSEKGIFRMTGRAKLTKFHENSHFITKIINSIR